MCNKHRKNANKGTRKKRLASVAVFAVGLALVIFSSKELLSDMQDDAEARMEYTHLRELAPDIAMFKVPPQLPAFPDGHTEQETAPPKATHQIHETSPPAPAPMLDTLDIIAEINPDFVGWIVIPGTAIDYPVVRGSDNMQYLETTFSSQQNPAGAIFMDHRSTKGFDEPINLVYGHNMRDGTMFSPLTSYLNQEFMNENPEIIILTATGEKIVYRIFEVRRTDAWDSVYMLDPSDAEAATEALGIASTGQVLILSTCLGSADRNARLLVLAIKQ